MTDLRITPEQADLLRDVLGQAERAQAQVAAVFSAVVRGHGLTVATFVRLDETLLTVRVDGAD